MYSIVPSLILCAATICGDIEDEKELLSVGYLEEEEENEIAGGDRDRNIPMLYDRNKMQLQRQRERAMRDQGICCPPGGPYYNCVPCPQVNSNYDIENHRYKR